MLEEWVFFKKTAARFFDISMQTLDRWTIRSAPDHDLDDNGQISLFTPGRPGNVARIGGAWSLESKRTKLVKAQADHEELKVAQA